jgi:hypothetical protein
LVGGTLYVPYGGHAGDCGFYYGWIVGVPTNNPAGVQAWATSAHGGGAWSVGGIASDGVNPYLATGNTFGTGGLWGGGESIIRFQNGPSFSGLMGDYWTPTNWASLDNGDVDVGGSGPLLVDVPGATPSKLVVALGKDGNAYLLNRTNLGGITAPLAQKNVSSGAIIQAAVTYQTTQGTYVAFFDGGDKVVALRIMPGNPPTITNAWNMDEGGAGSPFVTSTDGTNNVVVWGMGLGGDGRLRGFDGDIGAVIYSGGGANELMAGTHRYSTGIAARGRIFVANDNKGYAYTVPVPPIVLASPTLLPGGKFQFTFSTMQGMRYSIYGSTNASLPLANWPLLGTVIGGPSGHFQFTDPQVPTNQHRFYRVRLQ